MREKLAAVFALLLVISAALLFNKKGGLRQEALSGQGSPEQTVTSLFEACRKGDEKAYLSLLGDPLLSQMKVALRQQGLEAFSLSLKRTVNGLKGLALSTLKSFPQQDRIIIQAELVFADRIERQKLELEKRRGKWLVISLGKAQVRKPSIPYGTPVFEE